MVKFASVVSGNIMAIGWEPSDRSLFVKFRAGHLNVYAGVPEKTFKDFMKSPSKGKFFAAFIDGQFPMVQK